MKLRRILTTAVLCLILALTCVGQVLAESGTATEKVLTGDLAAWTATQDTLLDLNGYDITTLTVNSGVTVTVKDSQTDDYSVADENYGKIETIEGTVNAADGYLMIDDEEEGTSVHKLTLVASGVSLRAHDDTYGASLYYQCTFGGDEVVQENIASYGIGLGANRAPDFRANSYTELAAADWQTGTQFNNNSSLLRGIMKNGNANAVNKRNAGMNIYCKPYVKLSNGQRVTGDLVKFSLKNVVEGSESLKGVEDNWSKLTDSQKAAAKGFYTAFADIVDNWRVVKLRQGVNGGAYEIKSAQDFYILHELPAASHKLNCDVDMQGVAWTPVEEFSGTFNGNGKTISNLNVDMDGATTNVVGMFLNVGTAGNIHDLNLQDITVDARGTDARYVGTIAALNAGVIENCTVTGTIYHDRVATEDINVFYGALVARALDGSRTIGGTSLSAKYQATDVMGNPVTYTATGLTAKVKMLVPDSKYSVRKLVANLYQAPNAVYSGLWQDLSFATDTQDSELQRRRQTVVDYVYESGTIQWTPATQITYYNDQMNAPSHIHTQTFVPGTVYTGIPYTHCSSSLEQAKFYMPQNSKGVHVLGSAITQITGGAYGNAGEATWTNGDIGWGKYLGSDCSGALTVAWHKVSPISTSNKNGGGVCMLYTSQSFPSQTNQWYYGFRHVGNYTIDDEKISGGEMETTTPYSVTYNGVTTKKNRYSMSTRTIMQDIIDNQGGIQEVYEAYARTKQGDILVSGSSGDMKSGDANHAIAGHMRMPAVDPVVIRNANGTINPTKSFFVTHEQGDGLYERKNGTSNSSWRINYKYTFAQLAKQTTSLPEGSNGYYLPITMPAFHDVNVKATDGPQSGGGATGALPKNYAINSYYRLQCATLKITDTSGNVKYNETRFQGTSSDQARRRATVGAIPLYISDLFSDYGNSLTSGQNYRFTITVKTFGSDEEYTVVTNKLFTHS